MILQGDEQLSEHHIVDSMSSQAGANCDEESSSADKKLVSVTE